MYTPCQNTKNIDAIPDYLKLQIYWSNNTLQAARHYGLHSATKWAHRNVWHIIIICL